MGGEATGLDYGPAIAICRDLRWRVALTLDLLQVIEFEILDSVKQPAASS